MPKYLVETTVALVIDTDDQLTAENLALQNWRDGHDPNPCASLIVDAGDVPDALLDTVIVRESGDAVTVRQALEVA